MLKKEDTQKAYALSKISKVWCLACCYLYMLKPCTAQYNTVPKPLYQQQYQKSAESNIRHLQLTPPSPPPTQTSSYKSIHFMDKDTGEQILSYKQLGHIKIVTGEERILYDYDSTQTYSWLVRMGLSYPVERELFIEAEKGLSISSSIMARLSLMYYDETLWGLYNPSDSLTLRYRDNNDNAYSYNVFRNRYAVVIYPQLSLVYKYYFTMQRSIRKKKNTNHRNGLYLALEPYLMLPKILGLNDQERYYYIQPQYGLYAYLGGAYTLGHVGMGFNAGGRLFAQDAYTLQDDYTLHTSPFLRLPVRLCAFIYYMF